MPNDTEAALALYAEARERIQALPWSCSDAALQARDTAGLALCAAYAWWSASFAMVQRLLDGDP